MPPFVCLDLLFTAPVAINSPLLQIRIASDTSHPETPPFSAPSQINSKYFKSATLGMSTRDPTTTVLNPNRDSLRLAS